MRLRAARALKEMGGSKLGIKGELKAAGYPDLMNRNLDRLQTALR